MARDSKIFSRSNGALEISADDLGDTVFLNATLHNAMAESASGDEYIAISEASGKKARKLPQFLREMATDAEHGIQILDKMAVKLRARGYSVQMDNQHAGHLFLGEVSSSNDITVAINTGSGDKTEGLAAAIETAYEEVLRENKTLAVYMSSGQGAKRGA